MRYVMGFAFNERRTSVMLIEKRHAENPRLIGRLNGIGGKVEAGERDIDAMCREFKEETGLVTAEDSWRAYGELVTDYGATVVLFRFISDKVLSIEGKGPTDEPVMNYPVDRLVAHYFTRIMPNLAYLIPLALDEYLEPVIIKEVPA